MKRIALAALAVGALTLTGCNEYKDTRGKGDAPVGTKDDSPAVVTNMPDGFGNVASKCLAGAPGLRVTVTTSTSTAPSFMVVTPDEGCRK